MKEGKQTNQQRATGVTRTVDEKRLAQRISQGDRRSFEEFLDLYGARVHRLVRRYVDNIADAEDLTQEIFCDLYRCIESFRGESALTTWIYRVAVNHCLKYRQRRKPDSVRYEEADIQASDWHVDPAKSALKSDLADHVHSALDNLSPVHYDVVVLCELHGLTYQECARALDIPVGTVKSRLFNAIRSLRVSLRSYMIDDTEPRLAPVEMQR